MFLELGELGKERDLIRLWTEANGATNWSRTIRNMSLTVAC